MIKYSILAQAYLTDGLLDYPHYAPIKKLVFIEKSISGIA